MTDLEPYTPGAGGAAEFTPAESALSSLPLCEMVSSGRTCLEHVDLVPGTIDRVICSGRHERRAYAGEVADITGALAAYERRVRRSA